MTESSFNIQKSSSPTSLSTSHSISPSTMLTASTASRVAVRASSNALCRHAVPMPKTMSVSRRSLTTATSSLSVAHPSSIDQASSSSSSSSPSVSSSSATAHPHPFHLSSHSSSTPSSQFVVGIDDAVLGKPPFRRRSPAESAVIARADARVAAQRAAAAAAAAALPGNATHLPCRFEGPQESLAYAESLRAVRHIGRKMEKSRSPFRLPEEFLEKYRGLPPPFEFNGLGEFVYRRTYSRTKDNGDKEVWHETVERVVNGTFNMQREWMEENGLVWNHREALSKAQRMFDKIFNMKFLPPGRGLWAMGSPLTEERKLYAALNNCGFVSTENMGVGDSLPSEPFAFLMDLAMLGVGLGFDTKGAEKHDKSRQPLMVYGPDKSVAHRIVIEDSREGWVDSVASLIDSYLIGLPVVEFDYSQIRPAGTPIKGFGGICSGPDGLRQLHINIRSALDRNVNLPISVRTITDIMNFIGVCIMSGNIRQTAEIAFGDPESIEYIDLKNYEVNPERASYGWTSNNSVYAKVGMNYEKTANRIRRNGEPGFFWLENARGYSRMDGHLNNKDSRASGGNPCLEQTLESYELCCLVETFPARHDSMDEFLETLDLAFLYAKTVTLGKIHWPKTNIVMMRNRRIGCSMSGIAQFISKRSVNELKTWCDAGYNRVNKIDEEVSEMFAIPRSIKTTSIKPSGTVSLLAGATPGMHYPLARFCIRRVRFPKDSPMLASLRLSGYHVEEDKFKPNTLIVQFPIDHGPGIRSLSDVSMWEQLNLAAFLQRYWSDNQVSCTITFDPKTEGHQIENALNYFQYQLKGVSFLPNVNSGYEQMPIEAISEDQYKKILAGIKPVSSLNAHVDHVPDRFCDSSSCEIKSSSSS